MFLARLSKGTEPMVSLISFIIFYKVSEAKLVPVIILRRKI